MNQQTLGGPDQKRYSMPTLVGLVLGALAIVAFTLSYGTAQDFERAGLTMASRMVNAFTGVMLTCIALIVPLTANLYSPKLVRLYVMHPLIATGLSSLFGAHLLMMVVGYLPATHPAATVLSVVISILLLLLILGAIPFLYGISQFLRPSYFMPMLTRKGIRNLEQTARGKRIVQNAHDLFETIDVITNIALTGMTRGDRQLVLLSLESLHAFLAEIIGSGWIGTSSWRDSQPFFVPGLAQEGQAYLTRERVWPEAYVLAQMLKIMEGATKRQHEILAELASQLVDTAQLATVLQREKVTELHIMTFNTLMREVIEERDLRRFQNLSYYYRLLIETFHEQPDRMHEAAQHLIHYAKMAHKLGLYFAMETVMYDMGETVLSLARHDQERAVELVQAWAGPLWQDSIDGGTHMKKIAWRTLIRVYWEAKVLGLETLTESLYWRYLSDETIHREQVEMVLDENRELHYEFNDRLMRFAHLSPEAEAMAREFSEG